MTHLTKDRHCLVHDDRIDCLAIAIAACLELLAVDTDRMVLAREEEEFERYLNEYFNVDVFEENKSWFEL